MRLIGLRQVRSGVLVNSIVFVSLRVAIGGTVRISDSTVGQLSMLGSSGGQNPYENSDLLNFLAALITLR